MFYILRGVFLFVFLSLFGITLLVKNGPDAYELNLSAPLASHFSTLDTLHIESSLVIEAFSLNKKANTNPLEWELKTAQGGTFFRKVTLDTLQKKIGLQYKYTPSFEERANELVNQKLNLRLFDLSKKEVAFFQTNKQR